MIEREHTILLDARPEDVWRSVTSLEGINTELMPYLSMQSLAGVTRLDQIVPKDGTVVLEVDIRMFGAISLKTVQISLVELDELRFLEQSDQPGLRSWSHERVLLPEAGGTSLTDRLRFRPAMFPSLSAKLVDRLFRHRHAQLHARWNTDGGR